MVRSHVGPKRGSGRPVSSPVPGPGAVRSPATFDLLRELLPFGAAPVILDLHLRSSDSETFRL